MKMSIGEATLKTSADGKSATLKIVNLEHPGFMAAYIKLCANMHDRGLDFVENGLQADAQEMAYVAEKFDCIFDGALKKSPETRRAFLDALADLGGRLPPNKSK